MKINKINFVFALPSHAFSIHQKVLQFNLPCNSNRILMNQNSKDIISCESFINVEKGVVANKCVYSNFFKLGSCGVKCPKDIIEQYSPIMPNYTYDELKPLKVDDLKDICRTNGLSQYGKKEELIKSILDYTEFVKSEARNVPLMNILKGFANYNINNINDVYRKNFNLVDLMNRYYFQVKRPLSSKNVSTAMINNSKGITSVEALGGKGCSLVKLREGGFPVPEGFIITTDGYRVFANKLELIKKYSDISKQTKFTLEDAEMISDEIYEIFSKSVFPEEYKEDLLFYIEKMKNNCLFDINLLAVRSSATTEDLGDASFAGMHDTILNVSINEEDIEKAVLQCWSSLYTPRAILYRYEKRFPIIDTSIAVVVQRMVPSEKSGVIFSSDPQTSSREHISLDGVLGLGEALVSGMVSTDHWSIRKHYPVSYKKTELRIVERTINHQLFALYAKKEGGTEKKELKEEEGKKACFNDNEIYTISQYAVDIENYYKKPMDIEFCVYKENFYIVQARPITTLLDLPNDLNPLSSSYIHTYHNLIGFNYIQMLTVPWTYCSYSSLNNFFMNTKTYIRWIGGYVFLDMAPVLKYKPGQLLFSKFMRANIDKEFAYITDEYNSSDLSNYTSTLSLIPFFRFIIPVVIRLFFTILYLLIFIFNPIKLCEMIKENVNNIMNYYDNFICELKEKKETVSLRSLTNNSLTVKDIINLFFPYVFLSILAQKKITTILKNYEIEESEVERMVGGRKENIASRMDYAITQLHLLFIKCEEEETGFIEKLLNEEEEKIKQYMISLSESSLTSHQQLYIQWNEFMNIFGRRGPSEIIISSPRYEDKPSILLLTILNTSFENVEDKSPDYLEKKADEKVEEICSKVSKNDANTIRYYLPLARLLFTYREHPKYMLVSLLYTQRKMILKLSEKMIQEGILTEKEDIFHFSIDELCQYESGILHIKELLPIIQKRKESYIHALSTTCPHIITTPFAAFVNISEKTKRELLNLPENVLKGMPTSAGIVEGRAVVVLDPREGHLKKGDILVAPATDPAWTPLFVPASAAVIAIGGPLTHGSIVAREMGIPCVVNVNNLMEKVKTGMRIQVDGSKGIVEILDKEIKTNNS
ncbi:hypothetical protein WA158_000087 [Blastocystis sp. Blastoise]